MPTIFPSAKRALGIGKETTPGTAVAATRWVPFNAFDPQDKPMPITDNGMRGSMGSDYGMVLGPEYCEGPFSGPGFMDSLGDYLYNILGDYAVGAPVSSVYPHTFGLLNSGSGQPPTHTWVDYHGMTASTSARSYPYSCLSELTLSGNAEGLFLVSTKWSAFPSAAAGVTPTNAPTGELVVPAWRSTMSIAGSGAVNLKEWSLTMARTLSVEHTADGTQSPYTIARGDLTVSGKFNLVAADEVPLITGLLTNQQPALVFVVDNGGATTAVRKVTLTCTKGAYTDATQNGGDTLMKWDVNFKGLMNSTDAASSGGLAPIKAVLQNAITTY